MPTAGELIADSLSEIGVLAAGETPTADEAAHALRTLNRWIDSLALERQAIFTITRTTWTITANDGDYTVGTGGNVNIARPDFIEDVRFIDTTPNPDQEMYLQKLTEAAYQAIPQKALTSTYPTSWYYNPTYPLGLINFFPVPTATTLQGVIYAWTAVTQFALGSTSVSLPHGYERMIVKNLAIELCPSYDRNPSAALVKTAEESKTNVKRINKRVVDLTFEAAALIGTNQGARYDIASDTYL